MIALFALFLINPPALTANDAARLTLDRIYSNREFRTESFGPARWLGDGSRFTTLEDAADGNGRDIVVYDTATGKRTVMVPAQKLVLEPDGDPATVDDYSFSDDHKLLLLFTNTERVWRRNTRGDYWVIDLQTWERKQLGGKAEPSTLMFAKFSPQADRVAYVMKNNLYVEHLADSRIDQLTSDGSETIINGTFDWVYEEEFGLRDGFRWSPDGKSIAFWQLDAEGVGVFHMIDNTSGLYSKIIPVQYPKAGTTNSACRTGVIELDNGKVRWFDMIRTEDGEKRWFDIIGDPRNNYLARMEWAGNSKSLLIQHFNRRQNQLTLYMGDAETGRVTPLFVEKDEAWLDPVDDVTWFDNGAKFTWLSDRDGWRRAYVFDRSGKMLYPVTPPGVDAISILSIDAETGWLYYRASPENPTRRYLYRARLDGKGKPERISPKQPGTHRYDISPDQKWAFHTYNNLTTPSVISLVSLPKHKTERVLVDNAEVAEKLAALDKGEHSFFRVKTPDGTELDGYLIKPPDFKPDRKYPLLIFVYGEPWGQTAVDAWGGSRYLWHLMLTQKGYLMATVDNRGTPSPRGREWRKCVYGKIGVLTSADQAEAAKAMGKWDFVDAERIAIWGWSGGGSSTLNALFRYPEIYHTGMSVAPVPDQRLYDTIYQERYTGLPDEDAENYEQGSPITFAQNLKGNLLLVHGTGDDNVHYQGTEKLINKLIEHNKHFTMMAYPNRSHGIREGEGTTRHLFGLLTRYLMENMPPDKK
ncbi:MAG: S9 family peptidase [Acidobacteriota bacterium]|nr:S9 family peptidase [Acidobacteriota bacterium]